MRNFFLIFMVSITTSLSAQTYTPVKDIESVKAKIINASKAVTTIQSNFTQEKYLSVMTQKIIVLANGKVQIKDEEKKSEYDMSSNKSFKQINDMMIQLVQGTVFNSGLYSFSFSENAQDYLVTLTPIDKKLKTYFQTIQLLFDKSSLDVMQMKMMEIGGDYTIIKFSNKKLNLPIAADKFILK